MNVCYSLRSPRTEVLGWGPRPGTPGRKTPILLLGQFFQTDPIAPLPFCLVRQSRAALYCRVMPVARKKRVSKKGAKPDLAPVFAALRQILEPLGDGELTVQTDKAGNYHKEIPSILYRGKPLYFAGVRQGKNYVSYYLMSAYYDGDMVK